MRVWDMRLSLGGTIDDVEQTLTERYAAPSGVAAAGHDRRGRRW
jgi:hypothetical protein